MIDVWYETQEMKPTVREQAVSDTTETISQSRALVDWTVLLP